ncbi:AMIN domain-containing protein [Helicobacter sp. MIT 99-5507]|uniref:AMIN domain-containing protein n=1 Tax=Helicobacter sp. MIT 99-5507 TaxID=152489 RepID=UPI000E1E93DC|nr:AMIN domain-containing protein [Helicobacter sp. MIT 99-5507]RDU57576.1 AMIN domain-containing protein [Helicobacter sp. MIT 99-5507]
MKKSILFFGLIVSILQCRDNPFDPIVVPKDSVRPYYGETSVFDKAEITLPSSARLIKKIEVTYQNIDGSIEKKNIDVSGRIDWRMPLTISQILNEENTNKITKTQDITIENNKLSLKYEGKLLRDFIMKEPNRIVLDFSKNLKYYKTNKIILNKPYFKSLKYGLHDDFLRIVIELDGSYIYNIKQMQNGITIDVQ